ncbi:MAG: type II toxin-antitoxin system PemK/MazF family toxin [Gammaproteobacteria bacterium]|nr:type II toxin-antitoxin system PemK/MazF family toxin [Gammaproteobacteria bacterium]
MIDFEFGQVVLVRFPFTDQSSGKQRPAIVISNFQYNKSKPDIILIAVTSQVKKARSLGEALIDSWKEAGLLKTSVIKPVIFTAEKSIIKKTLGKLEHQDLISLQDSIQSIIGEK